MDHNNRNNDHNRKRKWSDIDDDEEDAMYDDSMHAGSYNISQFIIMLAMAAATLALNYDYVTGIPPPLIPDLRFNPDNLGTNVTHGLQAEHLFRFSTDQLHTLVISLQIPAILRTSERDSFHAIEGLCIVLRRLVYPVRYMDMVDLFGRSRASLSRINRHMMAWIHVRWSHLFEFDAARVLPNAETWSAAVRARAPDTYEHVMMFLDGHVQFTCRPCPAEDRRPAGVSADAIQRAAYCFYKHHHGFKCHTVISPSGMVVHYYGIVYTNQIGVH